MPKKIFDIFPPKSPATFPEEKPEPPSRKFIFSSLPEKPRLGKKNQLRIIGKAVGIFLIFLFLIAVFLNFFLAKAKIIIWPETENLNFREKITADSKTESSDFSARIIPAKIFEESIPLSQEFPASGKKEKRAEGIIRVYNAYSTSPQVLIANTRFVSAEGKLFRTPDRVTIAGGSYEKGKFVPGFTDIKVKADQPGKEYNITPSTFSIPGFAGTEKYTAFYGKSFGPMSGGGEVPQVTENDLANALKFLVDKASEDGKNSLKSKIDSDFILFDKALFQEIIEATSTARAGEEASVFNFQVKIKSKAISFKKSELEKLVREVVVSQIPAGKKFLEESLKINWQPESPIDLKSEKIVLNLEISAKIYSDIDEISLKKGISGKSLKESQILLENQPGIKKVQLRFWPFWIKKVPESLEKIETELNID